MVTFLIIASVLELLIILALVFKMSRVSYDGTMLVTDTPEKKSFLMEFDTDKTASNLSEKSKVTFRVLTTPDTDLVGPRG